MPAILAALNEEFIYRRGRTLPLEVRFPGLFATANRANCFVLSDGNGDGLSFAACELRELNLNRQTLSVFTVGSVFTPQEFRGRGLAGRLMTDVANFYREQGLAGGYLWTGLNAFYEKSGWQTSDSSVVLILREEIPGEKTTVQPMTGLIAGQLAANDCGPLRRHSDGREYFKVPPPGDTGVSLLSSRGGYLCGGYRASTGYIYELRGTAEDLTALLHAFQVQSGVAEIWVNLLPAMPEFGVLKSIFSEAEQKKFNLQMNLVLREEYREMLTGFTVPFLDRI